MKAAAVPFLALPLTCVAVALALAGFRADAPAAQPRPDLVTSDYRAVFLPAVNGWLPAGRNDPRPAFDVRDCPKLAEIYDLVPAKDAIPALQSPRFTPAAEAEWLNDRAPVLGLKIGAQARCYPLAIMNWHSLVHDSLSGQGLYVFFDPPSGLALARRTMSQSRTMALAGYGYRGVGLTYEVASGRLYDMLAGVFLSGAHPATGFGSGDSDWLPLEHMTWRQWRTLHPNTLVLSRVTGYGFDYTFDPYSAAALGPAGSSENYWASDTLLAPDSLRDREQVLPDKSVVLGFIGATGPWAVPLDSLSDGKPITLETGSGGEVTVHSQPDADSYYAEDENEQRPAQVRMFWYAWKTHFPNTKVYRKSEAIATDG